MIRVFALPAPRSPEPAVALAARLISSALPTLSVAAPAGSGRGGRRVFRPLTRFRSASEMRKLWAIFSSCRRGAGCRSIWTAACRLPDGFPDWPGRYRAFRPGPVACRTDHRRLCEGFRATNSCTGISASRAEGPDVDVGRRGDGLAVGAGWGTANAGRAMGECGVGKDVLSGPAASTWCGSRPAWSGSGSRSAAPSPRSSGSRGRRPFAQLYEAGERENQSPCIS